MVLHTTKIRQRTLTAATDSAETELIRGEVKAISIQTSASNAFKIYTTDDIVTQYLVASGGSAVTIASNKVIYPRTPITKADGTDGADGNYYTPFLINGKIKVEVSSGTIADTWSIQVQYEN